MSPTSDQVPPREAPATRLALGDLASDALL